METKDINHRLATEVMNLEVRYANPEIEESRSYYWDVDKNDFFCLCDEWNPTSDLNRAMMCVEKLQKEHTVELFFYEDEITIAIGQEEIGTWPIKEAALAICTAIMKAKE